VERGLGEGVGKVLKIGFEKYFFFVVKVLIIYCV
jgi:hypothetical protein